MVDLLGVSALTLEIRFPALSSFFRLIFHRGVSPARLHALHAALDCVREDGRKERLRVTINAAALPGYKGDPCLSGDVVRLTPKAGNWRGTLESQRKKEGRMTSLFFSLWARTAPSAHFRSPPFFALCTPLGQMRCGHMLFTYSGVSRYKYFHPIFLVGV